MENNINILKFFKIERLLNKKVIKRNKSHLVEYLVGLKENKPK